MEARQSLIVGGTKAGVQAARRHEQKLGRKASTTPEQISVAARMSDNDKSPQAVARILKIGESTLHRHMPSARGIEVDVLL